MRLEGIHHITAITGDAPRNVDFYVRVLGLRMVKKTVNFDAPEVYHLYYADELGSPGSVLTFFEFPGAIAGRDGDGMVHRICWRVAGEAALDFWAARLGAEGHAAERAGAALRFQDFEGLGHELVVSDRGEVPLAAPSDEVPAEHALQGFDGVRAYAARPDASAPLLGDALGFVAAGEGAWRAQGEARSAGYAYDPPPDRRGIQGAGSVHHVAFASRDEDHGEWRLAAAQGGARPTPIIDRQYFHSIYFREPSGVLFEIATFSPGFAIDEPLEHLGEALRLPPQHEHLRAQLERTLTPLPAPRSTTATVSAEEGGGLTHRVRPATATAAGRARALPRPGSRRARPRAGARVPRPRRAAGGDHAARAVVAAARRGALVRGAPGGLPGRGDLPRRAGPGSRLARRPAGLAGGADRADGARRLLAGRGDGLLARDSARGDRRRRVCSR